VTLNGWTDSAVVTVCGDDGRRGATDCDQVSGVGFPESRRGPEGRFMTLGTPPVPCPCVLRASTPGEDIVKTMAIDLLGVPTAPLADVATSNSRALAIEASVLSTHASIANLVRNAMGGRTRRVLLLTIKNKSSTIVSDISVTAALGRTTQSGETLQSPNIDPIGPHETRTFTIEFALRPPAFGAFKVFGTVYSSGEPISFQATTHSTPWLLFLVGGVLAADLVALGALRVRRRQAPKTAHGVQDGSGAETPG
jgi:hypothetical protein